MSTTFHRMTNAIDGSEFIAADDTLHRAVIWWGGTTVVVYDTLTWDVVDQATLDDELGRPLPKQRVRTYCRDYIRALRFRKAGFDPEKRVEDMNRDELERFWKWQNSLGRR